MADEERAQSKPFAIVWDMNHEIIFANAFGIRIAESDVMVDLGTLQHIQEGGGPAILSKHQLALTLRSAKLLGRMLSDAIEKLEERIGEIPLDAAKFDQIAKSLGDQVSAIKISKAPKP